MADMMSYDYAQKVKAWRSDGRPANGVTPNSAAQHSVALAASGVANFTSGSDEVMVIISASGNVHIALDGAAPSSTTGIRTGTGDQSIMLPCKPATVNAVRVYNDTGAAVDVTVQFLEAV
jgi:hypothetical protein